MATWISSILALLTLINKVLTYAQSSKDYNSGQAAAILEAANDVTSMVDQATALRAAAAAVDPAKLRDPDPHSRT